MASKPPAPPIWTLPPPPPRQRSLGRAEIVTAAIALADEVGAEALTMKAVAAWLGPYSPMSLYRYVHSKEGLIDLMLDTVTAEVPVPAVIDEDWRADLADLAIETRLMLIRHPWYAPLMHTRPPSGPNMMLRLEFMLTVLTEQGAGLSDAMTYAALIDRHILGSGMQENEEARFDQRHGLDDAATMSAAMAQIRDLAAAGGRFPLLARWLTNPVGPSADERFALGLEFLLDGIAARLPNRAVL